ncbi:MAG: ABC transporter ATP-binding protein, partial [Gammaproteobacteria bacterium]
MYAINISNLSKVYSSGLLALDDISLTVKKGDFFALLGPNGAGKSTTIGILTSLVNKTSGKVKIFDVDIDVNFPKAKSYIGVVPQEFNFSIFEKVKNILLNQAGYYGVPRAQAEINSEKLLQELGLWEKGNTPAGMLSGGMKRRLMIARALVHNPRLLILDEPTAGVDIELRRSMYTFLRKINAEGVTIILTTHYLEEAEQLCKNVAIIDHGKIIENTDIKTLINRLDVEQIILDIKNPLTEAPILENYHLKLIDNTTLEVGIA